MVFLKEEFNIVRKIPISNKPASVTNLNLEYLVKKLHEEEVFVEKSVSTLPANIIGISFNYEGDKATLKGDKFYILFEDNMPEGVKKGVYCQIIWYGKESKKELGQSLINKSKQVILKYFSKPAVKLTEEQLELLDIIFDKKKLSP
ncbi:MAG: hypothetical protein JW791_01710 [Nanoarchaeota archaeon]|nr:hypothetical protein [Nanoarchaeota archaeon]